MRKNDEITENKHEKKDKLVNYFRGFVKPGTKAKLKNNGSICKSVIFNDGEEQVEFAVFSNVPEVYYMISGKGRFAYSVDFTSGGDLREDCLYYRSIKGLKKLFVLADAR